MWINKLLLIWSRSMHNAVMYYWVKKKTSINVFYVVRIHEKDLLSFFFVFLLSPTLTFNSQQYCLHFIICYILLFLQIHNLNLYLYLTSNNHKVMYNFRTISLLFFSFEIDWPRFTRMTDNWSIRGLASFGRLVLQPLLDQVND